MSDLVGNPEDRFSLDEAPIIVIGFDGSKLHGLLLHGFCSFGFVYSCEKMCLMPYANIRSARPHTQSNQGLFRLLPR